MEIFPARRVASFDELEKAGDYTGPHPVEMGSLSQGRVVYFLLPIHKGKTKFERPTVGSGVHGVYEPPWVFTEFDDGSLQIRESIACGRHDPGGEYFHGYLDKGNVWRIL